MYRNDIKEMILILFALCEYNLRIVDSQGLPTTGEATTLTQSPPQEESKAATTSQIDTTMTKAPAASPDKEMITDDNQAEVYKMIETQIAAQQGTSGNQDSA